MILAVAFPTWLQALSTVAAAAAALASWAVVVQSRKGAEDARRAAAEAELPLLLVSPLVSLPGAGQSTMGVSVYNAGAGVGQSVAVLLVVDDAFGRHIVDFLRPSETVTFGSSIAATGNSWAFTYARSKDGREFVWDDRGERRELKSTEMPIWDQMLALFRPSDSLGNRQPTDLLRSDNRLY